MKNLCSSTTPTKPARKTLLRSDAVTSGRATCTRHPSRMSKACRTSPSCSPPAHTTTMRVKRLRLTHCKPTPAKSTSASPSSSTSTTVPRESLGTSTRSCESDMNSLSTIISLPASTNSDWASEVVLWPSLLEFEAASSSPMTSSKVSSCESAPIERDGCRSFSGSCRAGNCSKTAMRSGIRAPLSTTLERHKRCGQPTSACHHRPRGVRDDGLRARKYGQQ
mmetsp:Transcript_49676/g.144438  ORF Transcript_49676/g.144438 Transcript_49676/m.144438 type:complete len:222 (+) Transcript_49676:1-666(+)